MIEGAISLDEAKRRAHMNGEALEWGIPDLRLIDADRPPAPAFTRELPPAIADFALRVASDRGAPPDFVAAALIVSASAWLGNARRLHLQPGWSEPPHLWTVLIGGPSSGKTPAIRSFLETSHALELEAATGFDAVLTQHAGAVESAKAHAEKWKSEVKDAVDAGREGPAMPPAAVIPDEPARPRVLIDNATTQEIAHLLSGNLKGLLAIRDEIMTLLGDFDRYGGNGGDRAVWLQLWNGLPMIHDRVKTAGRPMRIPFASVALIGGLQPEKLREALQGADDGLISRFLFIFPDPAPFRAIDFSRLDGGLDGDLDLLKSAARRLRSLDMATGLNGEPVPAAVRLHPDAQPLYNEILAEAHKKSETAQGIAAGWYGKTAARLGRVALTLEFLTWALGPDTPPPQDVGLNAVAFAGAYLEHSAAMLERALSGLHVTESEADAATIARHLRKHHGASEPINERELYRSAGFAFLRDRARRVAAFSALAEAGIVRQPPREKHQHHRPPGDWLVNPALWGAP